MEYKNLTYEKAASFLTPEMENIAILTLNRPDALNALSIGLLTDLRDVLEEIRKDNNIRSVILTGSGRAFCAGNDLGESASETEEADVRRRMELGQKVFDNIETFDKPVIAAINGYALGGGLELALACDIRLASSEARMGFPEVGLGIYPGFGGTQRTTRLIGKGYASELIFTGNHITAVEAERIGLVNRVVHPRQLMKEALKLAQRIAQQGPIAVAQAKYAIIQALQTSQDEGMEVELKGVLKTFGSEDQKEGMTAFIERRKPEFKGR